MFNGKGRFLSKGVNTRESKLASLSWWTQWATKQNLNMQYGQDIGDILTGCASLTEPQSWFYPVLRPRPPKNFRFVSVITFFWLLRWLLDYHLVFGQQMHYCLSTQFFWGTQSLHSVIFSGKSLVVVRKAARAHIPLRTNPITMVVAMPYNRLTFLPLQ